MSYSLVHSGFHAATKMELEPPNGFSSINSELSSILKQRLGLQTADGLKPQDTHLIFDCSWTFNFDAHWARFPGWLHLNLGRFPSNYQRQLIVVRLQGGPRGPKTGPPKKCDDRCLEWTACLAILSLDSRMAKTTKYGLPFIIWWYLQLASKHCQVLSIKRMIKRVCSKLSNWMVQNNFPYIQVY